MRSLPLALLWAVLPCTPLRTPPPLPTARLATRQAAAERHQASPPCRHSTLRPSRGRHHLRHHLTLKVLPLKVLSPSAHNPPLPAHQPPPPTARCKHHRQLRPPLLHCHPNLCCRCHRLRQRLLIIRTPPRTPHHAPPRTPPRRPPRLSVSVRLSASLCQHPGLCPMDRLQRLTLRSHHPRVACWHPFRPWTCLRHLR